MPDEHERKRIAVTYCQRVSAGEVERVVELLAPDATVEDPVGSGPVAGREAVRAFYRDAVDRLAPRIEPGLARASHDGTSVVVPITVRVNLDGRDAEIAAVDLFEIDGAGAISRLRAYWGPSDVT
jgi:steroid delta-isomerase